MSANNQTHKNKLVFISNMASPYQVKFCYALQKYYQAEFWFHVYIEKDRPEWWKIELGDKCKILPNVLFKKYRKYLCLNIFQLLRSYNPDIILLGGFSFPTNYLAYIWAKLSRKKVILLRETYRGNNKKGVQKLTKKGLFTRLINFLYKKIDLIFALSEDARNQLINEFGFKSEIVVLSQYPSDIDLHFTHPIREKKESYNILFANKLIDNYNPLFALEVFSSLLKIYPLLHLNINNEGYLKDIFMNKVDELGLTNKITFLESIKNWDELHLVYKNNDILLLPAAFSNGNFTILEAMASGMGIVISDNILGVGKLICDNYNGFRCPLEIKNFVNSISNYIENPHLLKLHTQINRELVMPFSIESTAKLYDQLLIDHLDFY